MIYRLLRKYLKNNRTLPIIIKYQGKSSYPLTKEDALHNLDQKIQITQLITGIEQVEIPSLHLFIFISSDNWDTIYEVNIHILGEKPPRKFFLIKMLPLTMT